MAVKTTVVCGIYPSAEQAKAVVREFQAAGFSNDAISISPADRQATGGAVAGATSGGVLLSVHCITPEQTTDAKDVLKKTGAEDISSSEETREIFVES